MNSTFWIDGYRAAQAGEESSPPDVPVYADEYRRGYQAFHNTGERLGYDSAAHTAGCGCLHCNR